LASDLVAKVLIASALPDPVVIRNKQLMLSEGCFHVQYVPRYVGAV
jgi:hypothetical protein